MISEKTLKKWRKEALHEPDWSIYDNIGVVGLVIYAGSLREQVIKMTQELLDQHLLRKVVR